MAGSAAADLDPVRRPAVAEVLATSLERPPELPVDVSAIVHWCEAHHEGHPRHWPAPAARRWRRR